SPAAINCGCKEKFERDLELIKYYEKHFAETVLPHCNNVDKCMKEIEHLVTETKKNKTGYLWRTVLYNLPGEYYHLSNRYKMHKKTGRWYDEQGTMLWYEHKDI